MTYRINVGDAIPDFQTKDEEGNVIRMSDLLGNPIVLYFYPKDDTPGCTKEACAFRDEMDAFDGLDALVIGVSPDNARSHLKFIENHDLNFTLFTDEQYDLCKKFDVLRESDKGGEKKTSVERTTFVIDPEGIITWIERPVNVEGHSSRVLKALEEMHDFFFEND
jgi:peroxiredoxin Q/BCP